MKIKKALKNEQAVSKLTNEMLKKNSETLKQGSIDIAEESEKAIIDIETLQKTNQDLIETIDTVIEILENIGFRVEEFGGNSVIIRETPLPIPRSVTCSPSHIKIIEVQVKTRTVIIIKTAGFPQKRG